MVSGGSSRKRTKGSRGQLGVGFPLTPDCDYDMKLHLKKGGGSKITYDFFRNYNYHPTNRGLGLQYIMTSSGILNVEEGVNNRFTFASPADVNNLKL